MENGVVPKAVISNRIYLGKLTDVQLKNITDLLTYKVQVRGAERSKTGKVTPITKIEYIRNYKLLAGGVLSIPVGRTDLIPAEYEISDKRILEDVPFPNPKVSLRPLQQEIYDAVDDSCFINAKVGFGKTFLALHIARKLSQKTLVICHTTALRDQWIEEAESLYGMDIGKIGSGVFDIEDKAIVVSNVQSLKKHLPTIAKTFGTVITDEAHHIVATTFTEIIDSLHCRYRIGLSGTMQRKDGKHMLLTDFFSSKVYSPPVDNTLEPTVLILKPGVFLDPKLQWAQKINALLYDDDYQQFIAKLTAQAIDKGHSVLVIASRIEFLQKVKEYVGETCLLVTGETTLAERKEAAEAIDNGTAFAIAGSRQIFSEGISVNRLSAVVLAEPMAYDGLIEQIVGRIMRQHPDKIAPEVYDINFSDGPSRKQNEGRMSFYIQKGWKIERY
jgi:superfamily II DNA or RNA helicase